MPLPVPPVPPAPANVPMVTRVESLDRRFDPHWIDTPEPAEPQADRKGRRQRAKSAPAAEAEDLPPFQAAIVPEAEGRRRLPVWPLIVVVIAVAAWFGYERLTPTPPSTVDAVIVGASVPVFAGSESRLGRILVRQGTRVARGTDLFELLPPPRDVRAGADIAARLDLARSSQTRLGLRAQEINTLLARQPAPTDPPSLRDTEALRQRLRDIQDQRRAADDEVAQYERAAAGDAAAPATPASLRADRDGIVARIAVVEGMELVPGLQVAELLDCGSLSLSLDGDAAARAGLVSGQVVRLRPPQGASFDLRIPDIATRTAGLEAARLVVPLDVAQWQRAGGAACPIGTRLSLEVVPPA